MKPINQLPREGGRKIQFILTDIDDTLTDDGKLRSETYEAMWRLSDAGFNVVPITGRPAGWCELIARQWPVEGVVGENGALVFYLEEGSMKRIFHPSVSGDEARKKLDRIEGAVLAQVAGSRVAKDQFCRMFDLAIDFGEEEPRLGIEAAQRIKEICESFGAVAKVSSIHVNTWYGNYSKLDMTLLYLKTRWGIDDSTVSEKTIFCGDSPNDEPMFARFPNSVGVANVKPFLPLMEHPPMFITADRGGKGFCELAEVLIKLKEK